MWFDFLKKKEEKKKEIRYILTIDGGGMRGIVPSSILKKMNEELKKLTNRPLYSYFDLIAGTSTGALLALGLTSPIEGTSFEKEKGENVEVTKTYTRGRVFKKNYTESLGYIEKLSDVDNFLSLYKDNGKRIFLQRETKGLFKLFDKVSRIFTDKYDAVPYEEFLQEMYGETPLDSLLVPTMAVAFNTKGCTPYIFRSWDSHDYLVREAARASSAAPTYFAPAHFIDRETDEELTLLDGGLAANNPILCAYIEARKLYPDADEYRIISLSTASKPFTIAPEEFSSNIDWMGPLLSAYGMGNMNITQLTAEAIDGVRVLRVWEDVIDKQYSLDDTSPLATKSLEDAATKIWSIEEEKIKAFIKEMVEEDRLPDKLKLQKTRDVPLLEDEKATLEEKEPSL